MMEPKEIQAKVNELIELANTHTKDMTKTELFVYRKVCESVFLSARRE